MSGRDFDVIIVGAGVAGCVMATLLAARRLAQPGRVAIVADRLMPPPAPDVDWDLRVFALGRASQRLLQVCGIWSSIPPARAHAYERMRVWDAGGDPDKNSLLFDCAYLGEPDLGHIVDGQALQWQSLQAARASGAQLIEASLQSVRVGQSGVTLGLLDGRELSGQMIIGADGIHSRTRELLGIDTAGHAYHQDALVAHVRTAKPHERTARQRFLTGGPLAFLPLSDGRSSIVWSAQRAEAARLRALDAAAFGAELTAAAGGAMGEVELTTALASFPLTLQYALEYVRPRAVLLGDAAHVVHPLAGQGLNLGLLDCAVLAEVLGEAGGARHFGEHRLLRRYERRRRTENLLAAAALDGLERVFSGRDAVGGGLRSAALGAAGSLPWIKRGLARQALGLAGDVPQFLKSDRV